MLLCVNILVQKGSEVYAIQKPVTEIEMCTTANDSCYMYHLCKENVRENVQCVSRLLRDNAALKESKNRRNANESWKFQCHKAFHNCVHSRLFCGVSVSSDTPSIEEHDSKNH